METQKDIIDLETYELVKKAVVSWIISKSGRNSKIDPSVFADDLIQTALTDYLRYGEKASPGALSKKTGLMNPSYLYKSAINRMKNVYRSSYFNSVSTEKTDDNNIAGAGFILNMKGSHGTMEDILYSEIREEYRCDSRMHVIMEAIECMDERDKKIGGMMLEGFKNREICEEVGLTNLEDFYLRLKKKVKVIIDGGDTSLTI